MFLTSLALNSVTEKLYCAARRRAVVVLPIPGSPLRRAALEFIEPAALHPFVYLASRLLPLIWISSQASSHSLNDFIWVFSPITSSSTLGLYFSVHKRLSTWFGIIIEESVEFKFVLGFYISIFYSFFTRPEAFFWPYASSIGLNNTLAIGFIPTLFWLRWWSK